MLAGNYGHHHAKCDGCVARALCMQSVVQDSLEVHHRDHDQIKWNRRTCHITGPKGTAKALSLVLVH